MSPSASGQDFDSSRTIIAENSCLRRRRIAPIRRMSDARSTSGIRLQEANAFVATSTARPASAIVASGKRPMTCLKSLGLMESKCLAAGTVLPPTTLRPWIGRRLSTFVSAARKAFRLASMEKSVRGSFENSGSKFDLRKPEFIRAP